MVSSLVAGDIPWLVPLLAVYPILYVSACCHELGHALLGRWNGFAVTSFGMGTGRPFWVGSWRGSRVYLARQRPLQGITFFVLVQVYPTRRQLVATFAGGVLANFVLAAVALLLWWLLPWGGSVWLLAAALNLLLGVGNLVPFNLRIGTFQLRSDGGQIWQVLRGSAATASAPNRIQMAAAQRGLWRDVGDHLGLYVHLLGAAAAWRELGAADRAEELGAEAEAVPLEPTPFSRAYGALVRAGLVAGSGNLAESARALAAAEAGFRELHHEAGLFLVAWSRAELRLAEGQAEEALAALDVLAGHALVRSRPALQAALQASRLYARAALADADGVEALRAEHEQRRRSCPSLTRDLRVYQTLGRLYARREDWARAEPAYGEAVAAVWKLHAQLTDEADRDCFARCQAPLLAEAAACLRALGKEPEADRLAGFLSPKASPKPSTAGFWEEYRRSARRVGWIQTGINLLVAVGLVVLVRVLELGATEPGVAISPGGVRLVLKHPGTPREFLIGLPLFVQARLGEPAALFLTTLVVCILLVPLYAGLHRAAGRLVPALRRWGGSAVFYLALAPWLIWFFWLFFDRQP